MDVHEMIEFLTLVRDKVDLTISKVSIREPLIEISAMLTNKIDDLAEQLQP